MIKISLDASGFLVAQVVSYCMKGFIWMLKITLDVAGCLECLSIWMCINTQVVARCTKTLIWMIKISLDASGFLVAQVVSYCMKGFIWMLKITLNVAGCLECLSMDKFCLEAPTYFYECTS